MRYDIFRASQELCNLLKREEVNCDKEDFKLCCLNLMKNL